MKKYFALFLFLISSYSWGCLLIQGEIKIYSDSLKVHQKFNLNENYPYRTKNFLVHIKLISENQTQITVKQPQSLKNLINKTIHLKENTEMSSSFKSDEINLKTRLKLKRL